MARRIVPGPGARTGRAQNSIVTRGLGRRQNLVRQGFIRGFFEELGAQLINLGQSSAKRLQQQLDEIIVWAKLVGVNDKRPPPVKVEGFIRVKVQNSQVRTIVKHVSSRVMKAWELIKITVTRINKSD